MTVIQGQVHDKTRASETGRQAGVEAHDVTGQLLVNIRRDFQVRFSRDALATSVSAELFERVLSELIGEIPGSQEEVRSILDRVGLAPVGGNSFSLTVFGENSLVDEQGNHVFRFVDQEYRRSGIDAALQRINSLRQRYFNQEWVVDRATEIVQAILDDLNSSRTIGTHTVGLQGIREELCELAERARDQVSTNMQNRSGLEQRLTASREAARQQGQQQQQRSAGKIRDLYGRIRQGANSPRPPENTSTFLEVELLRSSMRGLALDGEVAVCDEVINLLDEEIRIDETSTDVLRAARQAVRDEKQRAEWTRDYGMAGGELLLNSDALTEATSRYLWGEENLDGLVNTLRSEYAAAHNGEDLLTSTGGEITAAALEELKAIVRNKVKARLEGVTIVDAIVALMTYDSHNLQGRLGASLKETASLQSFLAPYYTKSLKLQSFASIAYAPSRLPQSNVSFDTMLEEVRSTLPIKVETSRNPLDDECLLFYVEFFCVPLFALNMYVESYDDFKKVMEEPRFSPHSEIYTR